MTTPAAGHDPSAVPTVEVVKWYTRARKFPQLVGRTSDGTRLPGGPYTYTQLGLGVGVLIVGQKTARLWAHFGTATNVVVLVGIAAMVVFFAGRLPIGGRNPLSLAAGAVQAFVAPSHGRYKGVPVRTAKPHRAASARVIVCAPAPIAEMPSDPGDSFSELHQAPVSGRFLFKARRAHASAALTAADESNVPDSSAPKHPEEQMGECAPLTGVQRLLAQSS